MKKLCILLVALALSVGASAQKKWVGGGLDATFNKNASSFYIAPEFGYFVADNISVEGAVGLGFASGLTDYKAAATARYWFDATDDICYAPGVRLELNHGVVDVLGETYGKTGFDVVLQLGVFDYEITPNWSVRFNFCDLSLNRLFDKPQAQFSLKTEGSVAIKYYF